MNKLSGSLLTHPKLLKSVIDVLRERGAREISDKLPLPEEYPEGWVPVEFVIDDSPPHEVDHEKYDYYFDTQHPWRPVIYVEKGEEFDTNHNHGNWVKKESGE